MRTIHDVIHSVRAEYLEMPGLWLKPAQVQRLCGIDSRICQTVLDALVEERFLCMKPGGHYARATEGLAPRPSAAKAHLGLGKQSAEAS